MIIVLDGIVRQQIFICQTITERTQEPVELFVHGIKIAETYIDVNDEGKEVVFTKYNSKMNFMQG